MAEQEVVDGVVNEGGPSFGEKAQEWFMSEGAWWASSFVFHMLLMCAMMLFGSKVVTVEKSDAPSFEASDAEPPAPPAQLEKFEMGDPPLDPTELNTDTLMAPPTPLTDDVGAPAGMTEGGGMRNNAAGLQLGGLGGFTVVATGPGAKVTGKGGIGGGAGMGDRPGSGGTGSGFGVRGNKKGMIGGYGGTRGSERAVAAALNWLARHQSQPDGNWSLDHYETRCKDNSCVGTGKNKADSAATALALLPFLAAGQTHLSKGPYQKTIHSGLFWLMKNQKKDGDLRVGANMYAHGLASICLCEAYGLSGDKVIGQAAQNAINFIQTAQHSAGGWRYGPGDEGDTSVVGWQLMALKSGQMAYLKVSDSVMDKAKKYLDAAATGNAKGKFAYQPAGGPNRTMTSVGLLCRQYMGMKREDPAMAEGTAFLMANLPSNGEGQRDYYYWYYGTQVMHNQPGEDWDKWNRQMRRMLIDTQIREGCAEGSWDWVRPSKIPFGNEGGRIYVTSLATLSLEVYYRYLPLYKTHGDGKELPTGGANLVGEKAGDKPADKKDDKKDDKKPAADKKDDKKPAEKPAAEKKDDKKPEKTPPKT